MFKETQKLHAGQTSSITSLQKALAIPTTFQIQLDTTGCIRNSCTSGLKATAIEFIIFDYDKLTEDQEPETRRLIEYLELNWQDACLAPQKNKRAVKTASQQQVRQKVYKGSSQVWRKYEPCLNGVFDGLKGIVK